MNRKPLLKQRNIFNSMPRLNVLFSVIYWVKKKKKREIERERVGKRD